MTAEIGQPAPLFTLVDQKGDVRTLADLLGSPSMVVFMPRAFTRTCQGELCTLRDNLDRIEATGARVVVITCDSRHSNRMWAKDQGFTFPILSDFWPHGEVSRGYGCFNEMFGCAMRSTYVLDAEGVVTEIIATDRLDLPRDFEEYERALSIEPA